MKLILMSIFACLCFLGRLVIAEEPSAIVDVGYYENMSASAFIYASELINKENDVEEKRSRMRETSYMMFTYWCHSRLGDLKQSRKVDVIIQKLYRDIYSQIAGRIIFEDPLGWLTSDQPILSLPTPIDTFNRTEYKTTLAQYHAFIKGDKIELDVLGRQGQPLPIDKAKDDGLE